MDYLPGGAPLAELLDELRSRPRTGRMPSLAIYADSGMGKTMLLERFRRAHPAIYDRGERRLISPGLALQMASRATERRFYGQLLTAIGVPFVPRATVLEMEIQALRNLRRIEVRLLMLKQRGHAVGMCGDGANDAPALRQAQMGIVVSTATDLAKAAAGIVLTDPGLGEIVTCIKEGRSAFQRVLTYTLSILVNKSATLIVMAAGLVMTGHTVLTPLLRHFRCLPVTSSRCQGRLTGQDQLRIPIGGASAI